MLTTDVVTVMTVEQGSSTKTSEKPTVEAIAWAEMFFESLSPDAHKTLQRPPRRAAIPKAQ
jgi:hypothetical protein